MFDGLLKVTPDLKYQPDLALNVPTTTNGGVVVTAGGMDVTWTLRPGMLWSDGKPITCNDIAVWPPVRPAGRMSRASTAEPAPTA